MQLTLTICPVTLSCNMLRSFFSFPAGVDFDGSDVLVEFPAEAGNACVDVAIIDDVTALEGDERFVVEFDVDLLPTNVNVGPLAETTITIQDDDRKWCIVPTISISMAAGFPPP